MDARSHARGEPWPALLVVCLRPEEACENLVVNVDALRPVWPTFDPARRRVVHERTARSCLLAGLRSRSPAQTCLVARLRSRSRAVRLGECSHVIRDARACPLLERVDQLDQAQAELLHDEDVILERAKPPGRLNLGQGALDVVKGDRAEAVKLEALQSREGRQHILRELGRVETLRGQNNSVDARGHTGHVGHGRCVEGRRAALDRSSEWGLLLGDLLAHGSTPGGLDEPLCIPCQVGRHIVDVGI